MVMNELKPAIETFGLGKQYQGAENFAVKDLNLTIESGEVYGFLGPNGAGKSTTIKLLMNFIQPSEGHAQIQGLNVVSDSVAVKKSLGYLSGEVQMYPKMTGRQFLDYMLALQKPKNKNFLVKLTKMFQADLDVKIGSLSKGNRQKIGILQAFAAEPDIFILDEPTSGLDPLMQEAFFELVRVSKKRGATIFFSSHNLGEVQKICDRVGFIRGGKLIAEQTISDFAKNTTQIYDVAFADTVPIANLRRIKGIRIKANTSHHVTIQVKGDLKQLLSVLAKAEVHSIDRRDVSLEDEFMSFYRGGK